MQTLNFGHVPGLTQEEQKQLQDLAAAYNYHQSRNATKDKYYEGHISLRDVNLGIALPQGLRNLEVGCSWGQKAVDVLAARSMFDGFVGTGGSLDGRRLAYTLAIPKGDAHDWNDVQVAFFGQHFRTCGGVVQGIERMIPLCWNKKVQVVRDE